MNRPRMHFALATLLLFGLIGTAHVSAQPVAYATELSYIGDVGFDLAHIANLQRHELGVDLAAGDAQQLRARQGIDGLEVADTAARIPLAQHAVELGIAL